VPASDSLFVFTRRGKTAKEGGTVSTSSPAGLDLAARGLLRSREMR
jgi:hypothetical protein